MWLKLIIVYYIVLVLSILTGLLKIKDLDGPARTILLLLSITLLTEISALLYSSNTGEGNIFIYNSFIPVQYSLLLLYYHKAINEIKRSNLVLLIAGLSIVVTVAILYAAKDSRSINTLGLATESVIIVGITLHYFSTFLNSSKPISVPFWISCIMLFFWSFTFFYWIAGLAIRHNFTDNTIWLRYMHWAINVLTYASFGIVFLFYKRLQPARE